MKKFVKICPECGSTEIRKQRGSPESYICAACKHTSFIFPEVQKQDVTYYQKQVIDDIRLARKGMDYYEPFETKSWWNIGGALLLVTGIILLLMMQHRTVPFMIPALVIAISLMMLYITYLTR
ncbi:MAG: hypothetical protein R6V53_03200 [Candidatus Woesearchaeota archaeon]